MEIEIVTTKKKLTMSIVKQMPYARVSDIEYAMKLPEERILGYVNEFPYSSKLKIPVIIFKSSDDWKWFPAFEPFNYEHEENLPVYENGTQIEYASRKAIVFKIKQKIGSYTKIWSFEEDKALRDTKLKSLVDFIKFGKRNHIYL